MSLPLPGPVALRAVLDAAQNVGVTEEGGDNRGAAVETYLKSVGLGPGYPWCMAMVVYRLRTAAHKLGLTIPADWPRSGYCPDHQAWALEKGLWIPVASAVGAVQRGDVALFYFRAKGRVAHTGLVESVHNWCVKTIEGNTSADGPGVNRDGDGVYRKQRDWSELGQFGGFVRLPF